MPLLSRNQAGSQPISPGNRAVLAGNMRAAAKRSGQASQWPMRIGNAAFQIFGSAEPGYSLECILSESMNYVNDIYKITYPLHFSDKEPIFDPKLEISSTETSVEKVAVQSAWTSGALGSDIVGRCLRVLHSSTFALFCPRKSRKDTKTRVSQL